MVERAEIGKSEKRRLILSRVSCISRYLQLVLELDICITGYWLIFSSCLGIQMKISKLRLRIGAGSSKPVCFIAEWELNF